MGVSVNTVWEVRPTNGSDSNGGGFVAGSGGTDYSQQNSPQATGTATSVSTTVTATTGIFTSAMVGNYITDGTTWVYITAFTSSTIVTVDAAPSWTAASIKVGGALQTMAKLAAIMIASNKAFVKAESGVSTNARISFGQSCTPSETVPFTRLIGYTTSRGDGGQVSITLTSGADLALYFTGTGIVVEGFNINCAGVDTYGGIYFSNSGSALHAIIRNCKISNSNNYGINFQSYYCSVDHCEITSCAGGIIALYSHIVIFNCYIHDNTAHGIYCNSGNQFLFVVSRCVIANNSGTSDGINFGGCPAFIDGNVIYNNGRHGIYQSPVYDLEMLTISNNVITKQNQAGAAGIKCNTAALPADPRYDGNFFYNNTSNRVNMDDTATNPVDGVNPYTNVFDVQLTGDPFTNASGNDFTLNNTAGAGAAVRAHGLPGTGGVAFSGIPGLSQSGYLDGGVFQHQDSGGGGSTGGFLIGS